MDACNNLVVADSIAYNYVQLCEGECWTVDMSADNDLQEWVLSGSVCFHMRDATASHCLIRQLPADAAQFAPVVVVDRASGVYRSIERDSGAVDYFVIDRCWYAKLPGNAAAFAFSFTIRMNFGHTIPQEEMLPSRWMTNVSEDTVVRVLREVEALYRFDDACVVCNKTSRGAHIRYNTYVQIMRTECLHPSACVEACFTFEPHPVVTAFVVSVVADSPGALAALNAYASSGGALAGCAPVVFEDGDKATLTEGGHKAYAAACTFPVNIRLALSTTNAIEAMMNNSIHNSSNSWITGYIRQVMHVVIDNIRSIFHK